MSEYITRLREELVGAAAREQAGQRRRPHVRPRRLALVIAAAAIVAALVLSASAIELTRDDEPVVSLPAGSALTYRVAPVPGADGAAAAERSADILRARIAAAGISGATVSVAGDRVGVDIDGASLADVAALAVPGRLAIYDWEASVLGPNGRPAPGDSTVTGDPGAGQEASVSQYQAVLRAAKARGSGPATFWLVDDASHKVIRGPEWSRDALRGGGSARVVEVPGGVRVVRAEDGGAGGWYAIGGSAALGNADVAAARATRDPAVNDPAVAIDLTAQGRTAFETLTRQIAHRGRAASLPGVDPMLAAHHLAIALDDELAAVPYIDHRQAPDGIDGSAGVQISGGLTPESARQIATILDTGPMPATLVPVQGDSR
jgi:SecD/SecF fusion protein